MSIAFIIGVAVLALIVIIALVQRCGPRVTEITRTVEREDKDDDHA